MKITNLRIDGFGVWNALEIPRLSEAVSVVYGPNEAGKTTVMQFVRSLFFGMSEERRVRYLPPVHGGAPGGKLEAAANGHRFTLHRFLVDDKDTLEISDANNQMLPEDDLKQLVGNVDERTFNNVFVLGLREVQELNTLTDSQAAHLLYDLTLGIDRAALFEVVRELNASRERLLASDERPSLITQLLGRQQRAKSEIAELKALLPRFLELHRRNADLRTLIERCEAEAAQLDRRQHKLQVVRLVADHWQARAQLQSKLSATSGLVPLPTGCLERLEDLNARYRSQHSLLRKIKKRRKQLQSDLQSIPLNEAITRRAARIESLAEQQPWLASLGNAISQLQGNIAKQEQQLASQQEHYAQTSGRPHFAAPIPDGTLKQLRAHARKLSATRAELRSHKAQAEKGGQDAASASQQIQPALSRFATRDVESALKQAGDLISKLRRRIQVDDRLTQLERHETDLELQSQEAIDRQLLPGWIIAALGGVFALGVALILAGLLLRPSMLYGSGWALATLGAVGALGAGLGKWLMEHQAQVKRATSEQQLATVIDQLKELRAERDQLDKALPRPGGPLVSRLQAAEKQFSELEDLLPLEAKRQSAVRDAQAAARERQRARVEYKQARAAWQRALAAAGLPQTLTPKTLKALEQQGRELSEAERRIAGLRDELSQRKGEFDSLGARIQQIAIEIGSGAPQPPLMLLPQLVTQLRDQERHLQTRETVLQKFKQLRRKWLQVKTRLKRLRASRATLFNQADVANEPELRERAAALEERKRLEAEHLRLDTQIAATLGEIPPADIAELLALPEGLEPLEQQLASDVQLLRGRLHKLCEERGETRHELKILAEDRRLPAKYLELSTINKQLSSAFERWQVLSVCRLLIDEVRRTYERERQPEALQQASRYLNDLTGGRYTRVWTPLEDQVLKVDDSDGNSLPVEVLSRGTREQLFLSLRLALVKLYAARGTRLPLVLDDILVNFDAGRVQRAIEVLGQFANEGFQVLLFTCHEHIARLFRASGADVRRLPDCTQPGGVARALDDADSLAPKQIAEVVEAVELVAEPPAPLAFVEVPAASMPEIVLPEPAAVSEVSYETPQALAQKPTKRRVRVERRVVSSPWDAEEFEGELRDRVRAMSLETSDEDVVAAADERAA